MMDQENTQSVHGDGDGADQQGHQPEQTGGQGEESGHRVLRAGEQTAEEAGHRVLRAGEQAAEEAGRRVLRAGEQAAEEAGRTAQAGARAGETAANTLRSLTASTFDTLGRMPYGNDSEHTGRAVAVDLRAVSHSLEGVVQSGMLLAKGAQTALNEWVGYSRHALDRNSKALGDLMRCRSPEQVIAWQAELLKANIEDWLNTNIRFYEVSANAAREATDKIKETGTQAVGEAHAAE